MNFAKQLYANIEKQWEGRAKNNGLNPKSVAYKKAQVEFFCGAMAALAAMATDAPEGYSELSLEGKQTIAMRPKWYINILRGEDVCAEPKAQPTPATKP